MAKNDSILTFSYGYMFPFHWRLLGVAIAVGFSAIVSLEKLWALPVFGVLGLWFGFRKSGVQINLEDQTRREYTSFILKRGKWSSYKGYPDISCLRSKEGSAMYSMGMNETVDYETVFDLFLLSADHRKRLIVTRCKNQKDAEEKGRELAQLMGLKWTAYSPKISERTRQRRR